MKEVPRWRNTWQHPPDLMDLYKRLALRLFFSKIIFLVLGYTYLLPDIGGNHGYSLDMNEERVVWGLLVKTIDRFISKGSGGSTLWRQWCCLVFPPLSSPSYPSHHPQNKF